MKVTIALATYNVEPYIRETLDRIINQTFSDIEILCIDDASTDGTLDILREFEAKDSRIIIYSKTINEGLAVSRNKALELAKGEYINFTDGDDLMDYDMIESAYNLAVKEDADEVIWDYYEFGEKLFKLIDKRKPSSLLNITADDRHSLVKRMAFMQIRLFKTKSLRALGVHFPEGRTKQDQPVHWLTTICLNKIVILPERKYGYRISRGQTSSRKDRVMLDMIYVHDYTKKVLKENFVFDEYKDDFMRMQLNMWYSAYWGIKNEFKGEVLNEIRKRYNTDYDFILRSERRNLRMFYKGYVNNVFLYKGMLLIELYFRKLFRKVKSIFY